MKRYFTLLMAAVMTLTILVTGCGSKNQETGPRTDLNVAMDCDADSLAPWDATLSTTLITRTILFDPLCYYDAQTTTVSYAAIRRCAHSAVLNDAGCLRC